MMDSLAENLATMIRRPLSDGHVALLRRAGEVREVQAGEVIYRSGSLAEHFLFVLEGSFEMFDERRGTRLGAATLGPGQFIGEIAFLNGGAYLNAVRAVTDGRMIQTPREAVLDLMAAAPEMSDIIVSVLAARRRAMLDLGVSSITVVGPAEDRRVRRMAAFAGRNRIPIRLVDPATDPAQELGESCGFDPAADTHVIFGEGEVLAEPTPAALASRLGFCTHPAARPLLRRLNAPLGFCLQAPRRS